jgi:hypothetical protein
MGKGLAIFGLLLMIVGILPLIFPMIGLDAYVAYFSLGYYIPSISYTLSVAGYNFTELMLILLGLGFLLLIIGALR